MRLSPSPLSQSLSPTLSVSPPNPSVKMSEPASVLLDAPSASFDMSNGVTKQLETFGTIPEPL